MGRIEQKKRAVFICFPSKARGLIAEPLAYHLENYGIPIWYDRETSLLGDCLINKNINEGALGNMYALVILSEDTWQSKCQLEEIKAIEISHMQQDIVVFPVLYELTPDRIPSEMDWIKSLIYFEADRSSGTRHISNHVACRVTKDIISERRIESLRCISEKSEDINPAVIRLLSSYFEIDKNNINARIAILYAIYIISTNEGRTPNEFDNLIDKCFQRLFNETKLDLDIDYRETWLLENLTRIVLKG